jgi:hypothetical protein
LPPSSLSPCGALAPEWHVTQIGVNTFAWIELKVGVNGPPLPPAPNPSPEPHDAAATAHATSVAQRVRARKPRASRREPFDPSIGLASMMSVSRALQFRCNMQRFKTARRPAQGVHAARALRMGF